MGKTPSFWALRLVSDGTGTVINSANGPAPFAISPWQVAQLFMYSSLPKSSAWAVPSPSRTKRVVAVILFSNIIVPLRVYEGVARSHSILKELCRDCVDGRQRSLRLVAGGASVQGER